MQTVSRRVILLVLSAGVLFSVGAQAQLARSIESGAVFVMNNSATRNQIISFAATRRRAASRRRESCAAGKAALRGRRSREGQLVSASRRRPTSVTAERQSPRLSFP